MFKISQIVNITATLPNGEIGKCGYFVSKNPFSFRVDNCCEIGKKYVLSFYLRSVENGTLKIGKDVYQITSEWSRQYKRFEANSTYLTFEFLPGSYFFSQWKLEEGEMMTDYSMNYHDTVQYVMQNGIGRWCYNNNFSYIDGGNIYTGTITADKINVNDLFAQEIQATGTIKGATLKGAYGEFTQGFNVIAPARILSHNGGNYNTIFNSGENGVVIGLLLDTTDPNSNMLDDRWTNESLISLSDSMMYIYSSEAIRISSTGFIHITCGKSDPAIAITSPDESTDDGFGGGGIPSISSWGYWAFFKDVDFSGSANFRNTVYSQKEIILSNNTRIWGALADNSASYNLVYRDTGNRTILGDNTYGTVLMGSSVKLYSASGTTVTSDARQKKYIRELEDYDTFFDMLNPVSYKYKAELCGHANGRRHLGFLAQDVKASLDACMIDSKDFAGYVDLNMDGEELGLIYTEFVALNTYEIQKLKERIKELESTVELLVNPPMEQPEEIPTEVVEDVSQKEPTPSVEITENLGNENTQ